MELIKNIGIYLSMMQPPNNIAKDTGNYLIIISYDFFIIFPLKSLFSLIFYYFPIEISICYDFLLTFFTF